MRLGKQAQLAVHLLRHQQFAEANRRIGRRGGNLRVALPPSDYRERWTSTSLQCWSWKKADPLLVLFPQAATTQGGAERWSSPMRPGAAALGGSRRPGPTCRRYPALAQPATENGRGTLVVALAAVSAVAVCRSQPLPREDHSLLISAAKRRFIPAGRLCRGDENGAGGSLPGLELSQPTPSCGYRGRRQPAPPVVRSAAPALVLELALSALRAVEDDLRLLLFDVCAVAAPALSIESQPRPAALRTPNAGERLKRSRQRLGFSHTRDLNRALPG